MLKEKLAACVSLIDINSIYERKGKIEKDNEVNTIIESKQELKNALVVFLKNQMSYDIPQIYKNLILKKKYLNWANKSCSNQVFS